MASPTVDPVTGGQVPHFYADPEVMEERDRQAIATYRASQAATQRPAEGKEE